MLSPPLPAEEVPLKRHDDVVLVDAPTKRKDLEESFELDRSAIFAQLKAKFEALEANGRLDEPILFGINNNSVFKTGHVLEGEAPLRILEEADWRRELSIYCSSGIVVTAMSLYKGEITNVVTFQELGEDHKYELRYYFLTWRPEMRDTAPKPENDPRVTYLPKFFSDFDCVEQPIYIYVELKRLLCENWNGCCVCGIRRAECLPCEWNSELFFCSDACKSIAVSQRRHEEQTHAGGDPPDGDEIVVEKEMKKLELS